MKSCSAEYVTHRNCTIQHNNRGVQLLESGQYHEAITPFCQALAASKRLILASELNETPEGSQRQENDQDGQSVPPSITSPQPRLQPESDAAVPREADADDRSWHQPNERSISQDSTLPQEQTPVPTQQQQQQQVLHHCTKKRRVAATPAQNLEYTRWTQVRQCYIFQTAFPIPEDGYAEDFSHLQYAVTCMFNLALCHHLLAVQECSQQHNSLRISKRLYELAYNLLTEPQAATSGVSDIFPLAILNNLGQVHRLDGDQVQSNHYFEQLLSTLMFIVEYEDSTEGMEGFFSNVMDLMLRDPLTARAA